MLLISFFTKTPSPGMSPGVISFPDERLLQRLEYWEMIVEEMKIWFPSGNRKSSTDIPQSRRSALQHPLYRSAEVRLLHLTHLISFCFCFYLSRDVIKLIEIIRTSEVSIDARVKEGLWLVNNTRDTTPVTKNISWKYYIFRSGWGPGVKQSITQVIVCLIIPQGLPAK